jgi:hypothetical protein
MNKLLSLTFLIGVLGISNADAMPVAAHGPTQANLTIQVASGCGLGVRRGPFNGCEPLYAYGGYYGYRRAYLRGNYRGYRRGYYRGYQDAYYPYVYPYVRYYGGW